MNEQIRELYKQASFDPSVDSEESMVEKFAELIVQECAKIIETQDVDPSFKNRMSWAIKKHFGVEE